MNLYASRGVCDTNTNSGRYKCRCAPYNKMLEMEQFRFYRALYRVLLMVAINHEANRRPDLDISFISSLSDDELYQITEVYEFLDKLAQVTGNLSVLIENIFRLD